jgi:hypothetical protein
MLNLGGKCVLVCVILLLCGYSFGKPGATGGKQGSSSKKQGTTASSGGFAAQMAAKVAAKAASDSLARLDSLAKADSLARLDSLVRLDSIARAVETAHQDSVAKVEAARQDSIAKVEAARQDSIARVEAARQDSVARAEAIARANAPPYPHYEAYLDSMEAYVRYLLPGIDRLDSAKKAASEETLKPKSDYETQAVYEQRAANFDKNKQQKIDNLEKEYLEKEKGIDRLVNAAAFKEDFQPNWSNLLEKNTNADGYKARIDTLSYKVNEMNVKIAQLNRQLSRLVLTKRDSAKVAKNLQEKNFIYMSRLKKAGVLMQDYILQEQAKVLRTDRKKVDMSLGAYDVESQEFDFGMRDIYSEKYPFDYVGKVKIPTAYAEIIDRKTDDFTVSIDYINYPLIINGGKVFPGAKKAYVFYKDMEFDNHGMFRNVEGFENVAGYLEWALRVDSLISGKLVPQDLDASFAMAKTKYSEDTGPSWWTAPRIVRVIAFTLSAASLGTAIWQNTKVGPQLKKAKDSFFDAEGAMFTDDYSDKRTAYYEQKNKLHDIENLRNIFYISAGAFGVIGLVSLSF